MKPRLPITDKRFVYVPACQTDIRVRFEAEREKVRQAEAAEHKVIRILRKRA